MVIVGNSTQAQNFDFYGSIVPNGPTLFFKIVNSDESTVALVNPLGVSDGYGYGYDANNNYYPEPTGALTITSGFTYGGITYSIVKIDSSAFYGCSSITSVTLPSTLNIIRYKAFMNCSGISGSLSIPNNVTKIEAYAFFDCWHITEVIIGNGVRNIGDYAFFGYTNVTSVTIGTSLLSIGDFNFLDYDGSNYNNLYRCSNLQTINYNADSCISFGVSYPAFSYCGVRNLNISGNVKILPSGSFFECDHLKNLILPDSIHDIGSYSFFDCDSLERVTLSNSLTTVQRFNFAQCPRLSFLSIGSSTTSLEDSSFYNCSAFDTIRSYAIIAPELGLTVFSTASPNTVIEIPCGAQRYTDRWSHFNSYTEMNSLMFSAEADNPSRGTVIIRIAPTCTSPTAVVEAIAYSGFHFDHWSNGSTSNPYFLTVTNDSSLTAYFVSDAYILTVSSSNEEMGTADVVLAPTQDNPHCMVRATAYEGYVFDHWSDGVTSNPYSLTLTQDTHLVAYFTEQSATPFSITVFSSDPNKGTVEVRRQPTVEEPFAVIEAYQNENYRFDHWDNTHGVQITSNPFYIEMTSDTVFIAYFVSTQNIDAVDKGNYSVTTHNRQIHITSTTPLPIEVFDIRGRRIYLSSSEITHADVAAPNAGVYIVRIGQHTTKVVVL